MTLRDGTGAETETTLPPGTVYQGVVWEPWAFEMVQAGEINALSLEGIAFKMLPATAQTGDA